MAIQEIDLEIKHRSGHTNASADALSRNHNNTAIVSSITVELGETTSSPSSSLFELSDGTQQELCKLSQL